MENTSYFSIIVPTRNRSELLARCIEHIFEQSMSDYTIHVVDDGSPMDVYEASLNRWADNHRILFHRVTDHKQGVGPAVARNYGLQHCNSDYVAFCDDDDYWTDRQHLAIAREVLEEQGRPDVYITNQTLIRDNKSLRDYWNITRLRDAGEPLAGRDGEFIHIHKADLLRLFPGSCAHVNMLICKTTAMRAINGFWEDLRYAEDLDFYLRFMDTLDDQILLRLKPTSVQCIPADNDTESASRIDTEIEQLHIAAEVMQHVLSVTQGEEIRNFALNYLSDTYKKICEHNVENKNMEQARSYARASLRYKIGFKWFLYTLYLHLKFY